MPARSVPATKHGTPFSTSTDNGLVFTTRGKRRPAITATRNGRQRSLSPFGFSAVDTDCIRARWTLAANSCYFALRGTCARARGEFQSVSEFRYREIVRAGIVRSPMDVADRRSPADASDLLLRRARGGDRTRTHFRGGGFKPPVSANSTTRAGEASQAIRSSGASTADAQSDLGAIGIR